MSRTATNNLDAVSGDGPVTASSGGQTDRNVTATGSRDECRSSPPIVIVAGAIAPYTNRLYNAVGEQTGCDLRVLVCTGVEPQRQWQMPVAGNYRLEVLRGLRLHRSDLRNIYINPTVLWRLANIRPRAILIGGFSPTMMLAAAYARLTGTPLGVMTDGSVEMDPGQWSQMHRWMRQAVIPHAAVGIGASDNSIRLLQSYGLPAGRDVVVPIASPWPMPDTVPGFDERPFDVLFCGALEEQRKGAAFFADVLIAAREAGRTLRARIAGDGPLRGEITDRLAAAGIPAHFDGYVQPAHLPEIYASSKLFLFPSRGDPWGLVANEAMQCGTPVIGSSFAVSSGELVEAYRAGCKLELDAGTWSSTILELLADRARWTEMHEGRERARERLSLKASVDRLSDAFAQISAPAAFNRTP